MQYTLEQGPASNYLITVLLSKEDLASYKDTVLKGFQKDIKVAGFRP